MTGDPWRDLENYKGSKMVNCIGCGKPCPNTKWGMWCYDCNVERIDRINARFAPGATLKSEK